MIASLALALTVGLTAPATSHGGFIYEGGNGGTDCVLAILTLAVSDHASFLPRNARQFSVMVEHERTKRRPHRTDMVIFGSLGEAANAFCQIVETEPAVEVKLRVGRTQFLIRLPESAR